MNRQEIHQRLETIIHSSGGREYTVTVLGRVRQDGCWEGMLEFAPVGAGGRVVSTPVQTTQSSVRQLLYWAGGLSRTHLEDSLMSALYPTPSRGPQPRAAATPADPNERRRHLGTVERDILAMFREARVTRLSTQTIFRRGPHSNADFVRAFEDLEKQQRFAVRHTVDGIDWLELTMAGAHAAGLPATLGEDVAVDLPRPPR